MKLFRLTARLMATALVTTATPDFLGAPELKVSGEERVTDVDTYAKRVQSEALRILGSDLGKWDYYGSGVGDLKVYSRPVTGSQIAAVRSEAIIPLNATELFALLTSEEGFAIIDPNSKDSQQLRELTWSRGRAEEVLSYTPLPWPASRRSTLSVSLFDERQGLLVTKSILDDDHPPGADGLVRAFNSFALLVEPLEGDEEASSRLAIFDNVDLRGSFSAFFTNHFLKATFCQDLQKRLHDHLQATGKIASSLEDFLNDDH